MNVGSILNNDSPPSDNESLVNRKNPTPPQTKESLPPINTNLNNNSINSSISSVSPNTSSQQSPSIRPNISTHQRHSINNLLNDNLNQSSMENKPSSISLQSPTSSISKPMISPIVSPVLNNAGPKASQRNSIADITNDKDVDIDTGKETILNVSRQSSSVKSNELPKQGEDRHRSSSLVDPNEIDKLEKIKSSSKSTVSKPRRYLKPPVWAQEWRPNSSSNGFHDEPIQFANGGIESSSLTDKSVFNRSTTESVDLECSITNTIPAPSVVRTIAEWVYANFIEIPHINRKYVELELKFGTIMDKAAGRRLDINVSTECIYTNTSAIYFDSGVHEVGWNDMKSFLDELEKQYQEELKKSNLKIPKRKFSTLETDITDDIYQITQRGETPKSIRVSKDNNLDPPRYMAIHKQRISDLYIHNPSSMYDLRLSLSFEHPVPENSIEPIQKNNKPAITRLKKRSSWSHRPTVTRFDMTRVLRPKEIKTKLGKTQVEHDQSFEAELEIDVHELFTGFDKFKDGSDNIRFEELVEIFLNNARCLNNRVTRLASAGH